MSDHTRVINYNTHIYAIFLASSYEKNRLLRRAPVRLCLKYGKTFSTSLIKRVMSAKWYFMIQTVCYCLSLHGDVYGVLHIKAIIARLKEMIVIIKAVIVPFRCYGFKLLN
jgi:hypothetical protein